MKWTDPEIDIVFAVAAENPRASREEIAAALRAEGYHRPVGGIEKVVRRLRGKHPDLIPHQFGFRIQDGERAQSRTHEQTPVPDSSDPKLADLQAQLQRQDETIQQLLARLDAQMEGTPSDDRRVLTVDDKIIRHPINETTTVVIISDVHVPYHDRRAMAAFLGFCADARPGAVIINGDFVDAKGFATFPGSEFENVADDIPVARRVLHSIRRAAGDDCAIYYLEGNHEQRARRDHFRSSRSLPGWGWKDWLGLDELGIKWMHEHQVLEVGDDPQGHPLLTMIHGHRIRKWAGSSVRATLVEDGYHNVAIGHVHRVALMAKRFRESVVWGMELGGLYDRNNRHMQYMRDPDWQAGFGVVTIDPHRGQSYPHPILIASDGSFAWGEKVYGLRDESAH